MNARMRRAMKLYIIPDREIGAPLSLEEQTRLAVDGGATCVQLRDKGCEAFEGGELCDVAKRMLEICRSRGAMFIVNDRVDVALAVGADGVHIGQSDIPLSFVRKMVPQEFVVGVSVRTEIELDEALAGGASYLGFGAVYPTGSKDDAKVIGIDGLKNLVERTASKIPSVAIGGISLTNIKEVLRTGVDGVSVISAAVRGDVGANMKALVKQL